MQACSRHVGYEIDGPARWRRKNRGRPACTMSPSPLPASTNRPRITCGSRLSASGRTAASITASRPRCTTATPTAIRSSCSSTISPPRPKAKPICGGARRRTKTRSASPAIPRSWSRGSAPGCRSAIWSGSTINDQSERAGGATTARSGGDAGPRGGPARVFPIGLDDYRRERRPDAPPLRQEDLPPPPAARHATLRQRPGFQPDPPGPHPQRAGVPDQGPRFARRPSLAHDPAGARPITASRFSLCRFDCVGPYLDTELPADDAENGSEVVHRRIAILRQHAVKALRGLRRLDSKRLEAHGRIHEIAQDQARRVGFAVEEQRRRLVEKRFRECRIAPNPLDDRLLEIPCQRHLVHLLPRGFAAAAFRASYSAHIAFARSMSACWRCFVPPPSRITSRSPSLPR